MAREKLADTNLSISGYTPVWRDIMQGYAVLDPVPLRGKIIRRNVCTAVAYADIRWWSSAAQIQLN